jgi:hypothetical protein
MQETKRPNVAAMTALTKLFLAELMMDFLVKIRSQYRQVMLPSAKTDSPKFTVMLESATVTKGMMTTTRANMITKAVMGILHLPRSTMLGRVDFPLTVMYCYFPMEKVER